MDDRDEPLRGEDIAGVVTAGGCCFGGITAALEIGADVIADLKVGDSFDLLGRQAAVSDELAGGPEGDQPEPEAFIPVEALVPADPR